MADPYTIQYAQEAVRDIKTLRVFDQRKILDGVEAHLLHSPAQVSRSRIKRMVQPFWSHFRLRVEDLRVYYDVDEEHRRVSILRVLKKGEGETPGEASDETN